MSDPNAAMVESWKLSLHSKSPRTVRLYERTLGWFADWLTANGRPEGAVGDLMAVTRQDAEAWFTAQRATGLGSATIRSRWIALRNFYGWADDEGELAQNPMARVKVEKADPGPVPVLSDADLKALLRACEGTDFLARRDYAIVRLLASTGLRLSEVADLEVADVDLAKRLLLVRHGKGDRARFARFDAETAQALDRYKRARGRHRNAGSAWLWLSRSGRLTTNGIPLMLKRRAAQAGVGHVHAHQFRHTFAHRFLVNGGTEGDLQRLGGWESSEVMRRYGSAQAVDRALAAYDTVNPMGEL
jgi:site-specific recombinase XerD